MTSKGGLAGVVAGQTAISDLDPETDRLFYRGYDIHELAEKSSFEETAFLLLKGELPSEKELTDFKRGLLRRRKIPPGLFKALSPLPAKAHPMDVLRSAVSVLGALEKTGSQDLFDISASLIAQTPLLVAQTYRKLRGQKPVPPSPAFSHSKNFLWMLTGKAPGEIEAGAFDATLILYTEHGFNASTFAARVTASTLADLHSAVTTAVGTLKGPLHGGANEKAMEMLLEIKTPDKARAWVLQALSQKKKIMGFGHRMYKKKDSRHEVVKKWAAELSRLRKNTQWLDTARVVEETMMAEKGIFPNLDFYSSVLYYLLGIPIPLYTPIFAASRMSGWCAHVMEQLADNRLIRPDAEYTGPDPRPFIHMKDRAA